MADVDADDRESLRAEIHELRNDLTVANGRLMKLQIQLKALVEEHDRRYSRPDHMLVTELRDRLAALRQEPQP